MRMLLLVLAAMQMAGAVHRAELKPTQRQDVYEVVLTGVDLSTTSDDTMVHAFIDVLDRHRRPIDVGEESRWTLLADGEPICTQISAPRAREVGHGVALVVVVPNVAVLELVQADINASVSRLLGRLGESDLSGIVQYEDAVRATPQLTSQHQLAIQALAQPMPHGVVPQLSGGIERGLRFFPAELGMVGANRELLILTDGIDAKLAGPIALAEEVRGWSYAARDLDVRVSAIGLNPHGIGRFRGVRMFVSGREGVPEASHVDGFQVADTPGDIWRAIDAFTDRLESRYLLSCSFEPVQDAVTPGFDSSCGISAPQQSPQVRKHAGFGRTGPAHEAQKHTHMDRDSNGVFGKCGQTIS